MKNKSQNRIAKTTLGIIAFLGALFFGCSTTSATTSLDINLNAGIKALPDYETRTTFLKVDLNGIMPAGFKRAPLNIALVIDRSGSMNGQKINDAKRAAAYLVQQLRTDDIVSVITYSDSVEVLIPATKVSDKQDLLRRIRNIQSNGSTALFAGVSKGAAEVRKFVDDQRINRIILLSDGLANVGPSSPWELGQLGNSLAKERISVSTLGIGYGYNEDLMTKLAYNSDGNHVFVANSSELADIFSQELGELFNITAKDIRIRIRVAEGIEILRFLGRDGTIRGNYADITLNQVANRQEKYVMVEIRHDPRQSKSGSADVSVEVDYLNPFDSQRYQASRRLVFERVAEEKLVEASVDKDVVKDATLQIVAENTQRAIELRDEGRLREAEEVFELNAFTVETTAKKYDLEELAPAAAVNAADAAAVYDDANWEAKRKQLREEQNTIQTGQSVRSSSNRYYKSKPATGGDKPEPEK